ELEADRKRMATVVESAWREGWKACRDSEYVGSEAEDSAYGDSEANRIALGLDQGESCGLEADRKLHPEVGKNAKKRFESAMKGCKETDPIERLRFYCSLAMSGQDWLDAEPFFDALVADRRRGGEPVGFVTIAAGVPHA